MEAFMLSTRCVKNGVFKAQIDLSFPLIADLLAPKEVVYQRIKNICPKLVDSY